MTTDETLFVIVLVIAPIAILLLFWFESRGSDKGEKFAREALLIWAVEGPFDSGEQSAAAMRHAYTTMFGSEEAESFGEAFAKHAIAFDNEPDEWEQVRQEYLGIAEQDQEQKEKEKELDELAIYIATIIKTHFLNHGDLSETFKHDKFIVGYILGASGAGAHIVGAKSDSGYVFSEVSNHLFSVTALGFMNAISGWKKSGDQVFKDAILLGSNDYANAHQIMRGGDQDAIEKSIHELRGLEKHLSEL